MIAKNYIKYPEALRFQCEMFSNGYHNSPRIMRLMEVVFDWTPTVPQWWKDLKAAEARLIKAWKSRIIEMFETMKTKAKKIDPRQLHLNPFPDAEPKMAIEQFEEKIDGKWKISLQIDKHNSSQLDRCGGTYRSVCRKHQNWAVSKFWHDGYSNHAYECDKGLSNFV